MVTLLQPWADVSICFTTTLWQIWLTIGLLSSFVSHEQLLLPVLRHIHYIRLTRLKYRQYACYSCSVTPWKLHTHCLPCMPPNSTGSHCELILKEFLPLNGVHLYVLNLIINTRVPSYLQALTCFLSHGHSSPHHVTNIHYLPVSTHMFQSTRMSVRPYLP